MIPKLLKSAVRRTKNTIRFNRGKAPDPERPTPQRPKGANNRQRKTHLFSMGISRTAGARNRESARTARIVKRTGGDGIAREMGEKPGWAKKKK